MDKYIYGIFDDRKSARKFIQNLPELVSKHKGKIMSILEILDGGSDELEDILDSFRQIRINSIYQNEDIKGSNLYKNWYKPNCFNRYS